MLLFSKLLASRAPWYFTCRHTYENTLVQELALAGITGAQEQRPGLIRVPSQKGLDLTLDPSYALQIIPNAVTVSGVSVSELALNAQEALGFESDQKMLDEDVLNSPRGSLKIHALVPDMLKGNPKPKMARRAALIKDKMSSALKKRFAFARPASEETKSTLSLNDRWLLQMILMEPEELIVSLTKCSRPPVGGSWPCWRNPAGLANVDITEKMPSSAYRKLLEALACMDIEPAPTDHVVDLGACPGGWTRAVRRFGCRVTAIDRSPLEESLMSDPKVHFVKGDAFSFQPDEPVEWMVSDVIAYPERVRELLGRWCGANPVWANRLVVTMKFQGEVDWAALRAAEKEASDFGYAVRTKHFFNNKNEVTMCLSKTTM